MVLTFILATLIAVGIAIKQPPQVDFDYAVYEGIANATLELDTFKGICFAAPPTGSLRWQAPQPPSVNRTSVIPASTFGAACPQSLWSGQDSRVAPSPIDEDCLFLNVYAPQNATRLPALVWIHGGGYGVSDGREDMSKLINTNENGFIRAGIQYRLGAFGFLAGDEVFRNGVVNAGLLDQQFALQWIQRHIHHFGGDPMRVTIWGVSAGGGSVMLQNIAYSGTQGTSLFTNSISSSPYLPQQYSYADWVPSQSYYAFAANAGCFTPWAYGNGSRTILECLVSQNTMVLQEASAVVSTSGRYGTWAFLPVTDSVFIQLVPSTALATGKLNGLNHLTSNAAEEGFNFVPQNISTEDGLHNWINFVFPFFADEDVARLRYQYLSSNLAIPKFATAGISGPTALDTSATASGLQQTANLIHSESTFICPSYWLAEAYTTYRDGGYKFQTSMPIALHDLDDLAVFGNKPLPNSGPDYVRAVQRIWGNFVKTGNPSTSFQDRVSIIDVFLGLEYWPKYTFSNPEMINMNQTGGTLEKVNGTLNAAFSQVDATWSTGPGLKNHFDIVDANAWEGGRGARCDFWRSVAVKVLM